MSRGGSRGIKKPKLRDLSSKPLTIQEQHNLIWAVCGATAPISCAILGAVLVEHELEESIRRRLSVKEEDIWLEMLDEQGPLSTFSRKINLASALKIIDATSKRNLDVVRAVRNAFAHSKQIIDFEHHLVAGELKKIIVPSVAKRSFASVQKQKGGQTKYALLCILLCTILSKRRAKSLSAANRRHGQRRIPRNPFYEIIAPVLGIGIPPNSGAALLPPGYSGSSQQPPPGSRSDYPTDESHARLARILLGQSGREGGKPNK
jgi:hypothetical protein